MPIGGAATRTIKIAFTGDAKGLDRTAQQGGQAVEGWQQKFQRFNRVAVAASLGVMVAAGKVAMDARTRGREIVQNQRLQEAAFGDSLASVTKWAEGVRKSTGLSTQGVLDLATNSQDLLVGFGMTADAAAELTQGNFELAQAMADASGGSITLEQAMDALTKAGTGETEGLKSLGTVIDQQMIKERLREKGLQDLEGMELRQAQAVAIQELAMEQNQHKIDAWNESGKAAAEQQNSLSSTVSQLKDNLAVALIPAFERLDEIMATVAGVVEENQDKIAILAGVIVGLAGFVLAANVAWKLYRATVIAVTLATKAFTAAQRVLNLVLRANPIGLVITLIAALVAGFVTAYRRSETFRNIVRAAMRGAQAAIGWVVDRGKDLVAWFKGLPSGIRTALSGLASLLTAPFRLAFAGIRTLWNNTIGGKGFSVPDWIPGIGGKSFTIPRMHSGGIFQPPPGQSEGLALLRRGERVSTPEQDRRSGGDTFNVTVQAWSDRFNLQQVMNELRLHGVT